MKEENEITQEVKELLDSLEQHGQNARRQKELSDLIDHLERKTENGERNPGGLTDRMGGKTFHIPLAVFRYSWWIVGAAASVLLLWLLARPALKETPNLNEEILVEQTDGEDTTKTHEENNIVEENNLLEQPIAKEELVAEKTSTTPKRTRNKSVKSAEKPIENPHEKTVDETLLAENSTIEPTKPDTSDTSKIGSSTIPTIEEEKLSTLNSQLSTPSSPQRRVIRSLNLVCYECKTENGERKMESSQFSVLRSPFEPDPNMKNGSLAFEVKLH